MFFSLNGLPVTPMTSTTKAVSLNPARTCFFLLPKNVLSLKKVVCILFVCLLFFRLSCHSAEFLHDESNFSSCFFITVVGKSTSLVFCTIF